MTCCIYKRSINQTAIRFVAPFNFIGHYGEKWNTKKAADSAEHTRELKKIYSNDEILPFFKKNKIIKKYVGDID